MLDCQSRHAFNLLTLLLVLLEKIALNLIEIANTNVRLLKDGSKRLTGILFNEVLDMINYTDSIFLYQHRVTGNQDKFFVALKIGAYLFLAVLTRHISTWSYFKATCTLTRLYKLDFLALMLILLVLCHIYAFHRFIPRSYHERRDVKDRFLWSQNDLLMLFGEVKG